jgi:hypothetical protein
LFRYVALRYRQAVIERVLVTFLTEAELEPAVRFYLPNFVINRRSVGVDTGRVGLSSNCLRISFPRRD